MTLNEKIDRVFDFIEKEVKSGYKSKHEIVDAVAKEFYISPRELSTVFVFFLNQTLNDYIAERKMNSAYESIIYSDEFDSETAIMLSGLGDQPSFIKAFKKHYGMTPKEVFENKDNSHIKIKLSWDTLQKTEISSDIQKQACKHISKKNLYGLDRVKYDEITKINDLLDYYGFDELQGELAYYVYTNYNIPIEQAFRFVDEYKYDDTPDEYNSDLDDDFLAFINLSNDTGIEDFEQLNRDEFLYTRIKDDISNPEIRYVYFLCDMDSIYTTYKVIEKLHRQGEPDATQLDTEIINICAYDDIHVSFCKKAIDYFKKHATNEHGVDAYNEYINLILCNTPIELAFDSLIQLEGWNDYPILSQEEYEIEQALLNEELEYQDYNFYKDDMN